MFSIAGLFLDIYYKHDWVVDRNTLYVGEDLGCVSEILETWAIYMRPHH